MLAPGQPGSSRELITQEDATGQQLLGFIEADRKSGKHLTGYEYAVLAINLGYEVFGLGRLHHA